jgi:hypothetical protein
VLSSITSIQGPSTWMPLPLIVTIPTKVSRTLISLDHTDPRKMMHVGQSLTNYGHSKYPMLRKSLMVFRGLIWYKFLGAPSPTLDVKPVFIFRLVIAQSRIINMDGFTLYRLVSGRFSHYMTDTTVGRRVPGFNHILSLQSQVLSEKSTRNTSLYKRSTQKSNIPHCQRKTHILHRSQ